jgi:hypothetical protein
MTPDFELINEINDCDQREFDEYCASVQREADADAAEEAMTHG